MAKISCTFVKCQFNEGGEKGVCQKESLQIGGLVEQGKKTTTPICADCKPVGADMKSFNINQNAKITAGKLKGMDGLVTGFDADDWEVTLRLDDITAVAIIADFIEQ